MSIRHENYVIKINHILPICIHFTIYALFMNQFQNYSNLVNSCGFGWKKIEDISRKLPKIEIFILESFIATFCQSIHNSYYNVNGWWKWFVSFILIIPLIFYIIAFILISYLGSSLCNLLPLQTITF